MPKPLLTGGNGKSNDFVGTANGQVATWSTAAEGGTGGWVPGPGNGGSGGGGVVWYLNESTAAQSPTTNIPSSTNPSTVPGGTTTVKQLGITADTPLFTLESGILSQASYDIVAGFVTDVGTPDITSIPAGLWEFNIWAAASGNTANQTLFRIGVYKYDGTNAPTLIANSDDVYVYDPTTPAQYILSVVIPAGTTLASTDRIYVQMEGKATTNNRTLTFYFGDAKPSHVHTTIQVPIDLATDVTGILPTTNGGTGAGTGAFVAANEVFAGPVSGADALPTFRALDAADVAGITPYDLRGWFPGTPATGIIDRFVADRAVTISATSSDHKFYCKDLPAISQTVTMVVKKTAIADGAVTTIMTWLITNSAQSAANNGLYVMSISGSIANNTLLAGDQLTVEMSGAVDASFSTPVWTIFATA